MLEAQAIFAELTALSLKAAVSLTDCKERASTDEIEDDSHGG